MDITYSKTANINMSQEVLDEISREFLMEQNDEDWRIVTINRQFLEEQLSDKKKVGVAHLVSEILARIAPDADDICFYAS